MTSLVFQVETSLKEMLYKIIQIPVPSTEVGDTLVEGTLEAHGGFIVPLPTSIMCH